MATIGCGCSFSSSVSFSLTTSFNLSARQDSFSTPRTSSRIRYRFPSRRCLNSKHPFASSNRFCNFNFRCSITNIDTQFNDVTIESETQEDLSALESNCTVPVLNLKSDILDGECFNLLSEETYVGCILTTLPVLSEEEQYVLAATPAHPAGLYALYGRCLVGNLVGQLWNFAWPSAIALIHPSLLSVATMGFFSKLAIIAGGPLVGKFLDYFPRVPAYNLLNIIQTAAQLLCAALIIHAHSLPSSIASSLLFRPWFLVLVIAGAVERLSGVALGVAMERDWVVLLAGVDRPIALAQANAILNRIDLLCEISGALLFGILLSKYELVTCLKFAAGLMMFSLPFAMSLTWLTKKLSTGVLDRPRFSQNCFEKFDEICPNTNNIVDKGIDAIKLGWKEYMQQPVLPASLAYVLLYFNLVLTPGSLMTAFLTQRGLNPSIIGGFSGLCACMGVAATFVSSGLVRQLGILKAGAVGLIFQASILTIAVAVYWSGSLSQQIPLLFFLCMIVLSRLGHVSYDVVASQILQTSIPTSKANIIGTTEVSVASLAESMMLGVAIIANDVSHFGFLALLSLLSVVGAALMFCRWLYNPTDEQRRLFSFYPRNSH